MQSKFGIRDINAQNHWRCLELANFQMKSPLIVCLSGSGTKTTVEANGFCKLAESLLGENSQHTTILGVSYGHDDERPNFPAALSNKEIDAFVDNVLLPLCFDKQGKLYPLEKCCKNLSMVTFFTFCHGSIETNRIIEKLDKTLQSKGLSEEEVKQVNASLLEISYDSEDSITNCPRIQFSPDTCSRGPLMRARLFDDEDFVLKNVTIVHDKPGELGHMPVPYQRNCEQVNFISGSILKTRKEEDPFALQLLDQEHNVGYFKADKEGSLNENLSDQGKILRQAMSMSLNARIENNFENAQSTQYKQFNLETLCKNALKKLAVRTPKQLLEEVQEAK